MNQRSTQTEPAITGAPFQQVFLRSPACTQASSGKESWDGTPRSPLTDNSYSTTGSQESATLDLFEQTSRNLWAMSCRSYGQDGNGNLDYSATPSGDAHERSHLGGLALSLTELPSPSLVVQEKLRNSAKGRLARNPHCNGYTLQQQGLLRRGNNSYRHLFKQVTQVGSGQSLVDMGVPDATPTVEQLVMVVKSLPGNQPVIPVVAHGLHFMDSRAVAALLKEIAKGGLPQRSIEIFDWLRGLQACHELHHLCDVYTYTTVIALCGQRQSLRLALELVAEMRSRGVTRNVHTYSALMNTCIKCGELELALDVFEQLKRERCVPNVVTFNTLVDVYGKLGRWQDAICVIDKVYMEGLEPEARTFNTVIIAANICNQPLEALKVYDRMLASGFKPTDTTYTALISAYGKAGQLEKAMEVFEQMVQQNCERNIITYGSLIAACEKAGRWELALHLLDEMQKDRVPPNTMTFSALLSACARGGQSERAEALFHLMLARRCKPDAAAYHSLLLAHIRAGNWRAAMQALDITPAGNKSEPWIYAALIQCLWESGALAAQAHAAKLFGLGMRVGLVPSPLQQASSERCLEVTVSAANTSLAVLGAIKWLCECLETLEVKRDPFTGTRQCIITANPSTELGGPAGDSIKLTQEIFSVLSILLKGLQSPFRSEEFLQPGTRLVAESAEVSEWLQTQAAKTAIMEYLPSASYALTPAYDSLAYRSTAAQEAAANARLAEAHILFCQVEKHQEARMGAAQAVYLGSREDCLRLTSELATRFGIPAEGTYRSMLLLDYALIAGAQYNLGRAALMVAACLTISAQLCGLGASIPQDALESILTLPSGALTPVIEQLQQLGAAEVPLASPMAAAHQYLGQLLHDSLLDHGKSDIQETRSSASRVLGSCTDRLVLAMTHSSTQHIRPSLLAAAVVAVDRRARGALPVWPVSLARWTGIPAADDSGTFEVAMRLVATLQRPTSATLPQSAP